MIPSLVDYHWPQIQTDLFFFRWDFRLLLTDFEENMRWSQILKLFLINVFCWRWWQDLLWAQGLERWTPSWKKEGEDKMSFQSPTKSDSTLIQATAGGDGEEQRERCQKHPGFWCWIFNKGFWPPFLQMDLEERLSAALQDAARAKDVLRSMRWNSNLWSLIIL